ncbi:MAG: transporter substrate-binding domain-containing protein [Rhodospirillales bacterium]|nr:transporter substrate-binding domain-containing protein [Rhodospirillales bacterium]
MRRILEIWVFRLFVAGLFLLGPLTSPQETQAATEKVSVAYCIDCVPFQFKDDNGKPAGLIIDLWQLWSQKTGIEIDFRAASWDETLRMVRDGKADAHAGLFFNDERNKYLEYGSPLVETDTHFFTHRDLPAIDTVEGLAGRKIGVLAGDFVEGFLKQRLAPETIIGFESYEALMAALGDGKLKAFAADTPTGIHHLKKSGLGDMFKLPAEPLYRNGWFVAARKGNSKLISVINAGMGLIEVPERRQIARRWSAGSDRKSADVQPWEGIGDVLTKKERQWLSQHPVIRLTPDPAFPPIEFFNEKGNFRGIGAEVTRLMEERLGIRFKIVRAKNWAESTRLTKRRENDVWSVASPTKGRKNYMLFTDPYVESPLVIVVRKQNRETLRPKDLRDMKVTYVYDYAGGDWMTTNYPRFNYIPAPDTQTGLKMVSFGIADAMVVSAALASYYIDAEAITNLRVAGETGHVLRWGFASRSDWPILNGILKKGLDLVTPEERQAIHRKWFFLEAAPWKLTRQHVIIGLVVLGALIVIGVLTWNRALQRQITRRIAAQAQAEERLAHAIENISQGFALFNADDKLVMCNANYRNIYGYSNKDARAGASIKFLLQLDIERGIVDEKSGGIDKTRDRTERFGKTQEIFDIPLANGRWVQIRDRPTDDGGTVSIHSDITTHKQAEETLRMGKEEAERSAEAKSDFVAMVSHEVRTPMNGVLGMAGLLEDMKLDAEQRECVETIVASGKALLTIIDDLLDVSKLDADKLELEQIPLIVADVVAAAMAVMAPQAEEKGLAFTATIDPAIPPVLIGDPHRLRQVLLNLISNAIKFTDQGSVNIEARIALKNELGVILAFSVTDTGQGISEEAQENLFAEYTQVSTDVARKHGGTGLGLSISRRLIGLMGGEISIESAPGEGSSFSFLTQFAIAEPAETRAWLDAAGSDQTRRQRSASRRLKVLQVEDNQINQDVAAKILTRAGHDVSSVENGVEAMQVIETGGFDIVLMDRDMPKMDGLEATRRIRALFGPISTIPILGITASAIRSQLDDCLEAGMNMVLTKPVDARKLRDALERLTAVSRTVLVIDDTEINRTVAAKQLGKLGYACELADGGAKALEMTGRTKFDAILADISMPGMDGLEFLDRFREQDNAKTPVIALTGHKTPEDRARFLAAGMDDVLSKPVILEELAATLEKWCALGPDERDAGQDPIDLGQLSEILGEEDEAELFKMLNFFTQQFPDLLASLQGAVGERNAKSVRDKAHAAKSAATYAAAISLSAQLEKLEKQAQDEDWDDIAVLSAAIESEYARVVAFCAKRREGP